MLKEKPKAAPLPLKHMAIQEARQQTTQSRQDENSFAVDEVENSTILVADKGGQALKRARQDFAVKSIRHRDNGNIYHGDKYFQEDKSTEASYITVTHGAEPQKNVYHGDKHLDRAKSGAESKTASHSKVKGTAKQTQAYKEQGLEFAKRKTIKQTRAKAERKAALADKIKKAIQRSVTESGKSLLLLGGAVLIAIIPLLVVLGIAGSIFTVDVDKAPVSEEVKAYAGVIQVYAMEHGIPEYAELIMAVMMQESGGRGNDPMQASESAFNTEYPNYPNGITDPEYSINVGIQALADVLSLAGVTDIEDTESLYIALQAYNFGPGYISYAYNNGGHSELAALAFSEMMAQRMGWESYGDPYYVQHVIRYLSNAE